MIPGAAQIGDEIRITIGRTREDYQNFILCKRLPCYRVEGRAIWTDLVSYQSVFGGGLEVPDISGEAPHLMKFQRDLVERALSRRRFAMFADCGLGKTPMGLAWALHVAQAGKVLILVPLAVFTQWKREAKRWHNLTLTDLRAREEWTDGIAILNWEANREIDMSGVTGIVLDESSILKNSSGKTKKWLVELARGIPYRLALSATPAPNDHFEYACHATWLGFSRTEKEFASKYFKKDGIRWKLRGHAKGPFYKNLSIWATYIHSPRSLGYADTTEMEMEPSYLYKRVSVHDGWRSKSGELFGSAALGVDRSGIMGEMRSCAGPRMQAIVDYSRGKRLIVWVGRNAEETAIARALRATGASVAVLNGNTPIEDRIAQIDAYRAGSVDHIISKPRVMGWGVNLPECDHMVYSGFNYSFEETYQAIRRAHRYGRQGRLGVMFPYTDPEAAILTRLREKMDRFQEDVRVMQSRFWTKT